MRSTFFGLNIGAKGLAAQQRALDITGHNIANANTKGYTRQEAVMQSSTPIKTNQGFVGTGVEITDIRRIRDNYLDLQVRSESKTLGYWEFKSDIFQKIEVILNEPSNAGLRTTMDKFWSAWEDLSRKPESSAVRTTVIQTGQGVVDTFNHMDQQFRDLRDDIDESVNVTIRELNSLAKQIRDLNYQIVKGEAGGHKANDLRDKRDLLIDEMAKLVDIDVIEDQWGAVTVSIGGRAIVSGNVLNQLEGRINTENNNLTDVVWADGTAVKIRSGKLQAMLETRDQLVVDFMKKLDLMAYEFATAVNEVHKQGYHISENPPAGYGSTGADFFVVTDITSDFSAANIAINLDIINDVNLIAAATTDPDGNIENILGDGSNALKIAQLKYDNSLINGTTLDDYYRSETAKLGVASQEAQRMVENQGLMVAQLESKREMVMGVSLDEEMTNMVRFQHAYSSAARYITAVDQMLDILVNRLGLFGR